MERLSLEMLRTERRTLMKTEGQELQTYRMSGELGPLRWTLRLSSVMRLAFTPCLMAMCHGILWHFTMERRSWCCYTPDCRGQRISSSRLVSRWEYHGKYCKTAIIPAERPLPPVLISRNTTQSSASRVSVDIMYSDQRPMHSAWSLHLVSQSSRRVLDRILLSALDLFQECLCRFWV